MMHSNKGFPAKRPAFGGADTKEERKDADAKQMRLFPTQGLALVHVGSPLPGLPLPVELGSHQRKWKDSASKYS